MRETLRYLSLCACVAWLAPGVGALRAQEPDELRAHWEKLGAKMGETEARIEQLKGKRHEIGDRDRDAVHEVEQAIEKERRRLKELEQERRALAERLERPMGERGLRDEIRAKVRDIDREISEMKGHVLNLSRELKEVGGEGSDRGRDLIHEIEKVKGRIGELMEKRGHLLRETGEARPGPGPERGLEELDRRIDLMRHAAGLLHEAGAPELAEAAERRANELERELRRAIEARERRGGPEHPEGPPVEHLQRSVDELRGEVHELRETLRGLKEHLQHMER